MLLKLLISAQQAVLHLLDDSLHMNELLFTLKNII